MPTEHNIRQLIINKLTDEEYEQAVKSADELYLTPDSGSGGGTVTSVRVQATSPVESSQSTEQTTTLNTTISLANNYGDTKNPYASKTKNYVLAAPVSANGTPSFRALDKADIPLASETAASGGTTTSLVTTGEKYTWNNKQDALPSQSGQSGKFLSTNGSSLYWASTGGGGSGYVPLPTVTTLTDTTYTLTVAENTIYKFSNAITSLTISSITISDLESLIYFTTGSSITFVDNSTLKWGGGSIPSLDTNTTYCIAIKNGLAELDKFGR